MRFSLKRTPLSNTKLLMYTNLCVNGIIGFDFISALGHSLTFSAANKYNKKCHNNFLTLITNREFSLTFRVKSLFNTS